MGELVLTMVPRVKLAVLIGSMFIIGITVPAGLYSATRAGPAHLESPGVPVSETEFRDLVGLEWDSAVFHGAYLTRSTRPYIVQVNFSADSAIELNVAVDTAKSFIDSQVMDFLDPEPNRTALSTDLPKWSIRFTGGNQSQQLVVAVGINAITGKIVEYHQHWKGSPVPELVSEPINPDEEPCNDTTIRAKLADFMALRGYSVPDTMRLLRTTPMPNDTHPAVYAIELANCYGSVLLDQNYQGVYSRIDAVTGEILDFRYQMMDFPVIAYETPISPDIVKQHVTVDNLWLEDYNYLGAFLRFISQGIPELNQSIQFQLAWALQFYNHTESPDVFEIYRDAFDGSEIVRRGALYVHIGAFIMEARVAVIVVIAISGLVAALIYITVRKSILDQG